VVYEFSTKVPTAIASANMMNNTAINFVENNISANFFWSIPYILFYKDTYKALIYYKDTFQNPEINKTLSPIFEMCIQPE